ncbi:MAG: methyltransferase [Rhizobacter sp.]|nr:methyltransferase [Burkholderiales bacterium]
MADSRYTLPKASKRGAAEAEALNRQLLAVEADIEAGRLSEAAATLNQLVVAHPKDGRLYVAGWLLANKAGNVEAAYQSARHAVALAPTSGTALYCLSDAEHKRGNIDAARKSVEQALLYTPTNLLVLQHAINLANAQSDHAVSERYLRTAFAQNSEIPHIKTMIGNSLRYQSRHDESELWLNEAITLDADDADAHHGLAMIAYLRDQHAKAAEHLAHALRVRPDDDGFLYMNAIFSGETPALQPEGMARGLFDRYAKSFDTHLVGALKYRVPHLIAKMIVERFPERNLNVLDLGCGTGLLGAELGSINGYFVGVDLSLPMLEEAKKRSVYSRLHHVNLLDSLDATDASEYEVIVAADVLIYIGALDVLIRNCFKVLKPGGWLFFSCEAAADDGPDFVLRKSMRYAQTTQYVTRLLGATGFAAPSIQAIDLRMEQDTVIPGYLVAVQKPA